MIQSKKKKKRATFLGAAKTIMLVPGGYCVMVHVGIVVLYEVIW